VHSVATGRFSNWNFTERFPAMNPKRGWSRRNRKATAKVLKSGLSAPTLKFRNRPFIRLARLFAGPKSNLDGTLLHHSFLHGKAAANASSTTSAAPFFRDSGWATMNLATT
jgi:hypothetical protein